MASQATAWQLVTAVPSQGPTHPLCSLPRPVFLCNPSGSCSFLAPALQTMPSLQCPPIAYHPCPPPPTIPVPSEALQLLACCVVCRLLRRLVVDGRRCFACPHRFPLFICLWASAVAWLLCRKSNQPPLYRRTDPCPAFFPRVAGAQRWTSPNSTSALPRGHCCCFFFGCVLPSPTPAWPASSPDPHLALYPANG
eukprot:EG_transcript_14425